jgi:GAF domain-containing protein
VADLDAYRKLYEFSARLMTNYDLPELLAALMDHVIQITNADKGFLILLEGGQLDVKVARNLKKENIADAVSQLSDAIVAKVVHERRPIIISDAMNDAEFAASMSVMNLKLSSVMCVPLLERGNLMGLIYVGNDSVANLFEAERLEVLTVFAAQASLIIRNALLVNELQLDNRMLHDKLEQLGMDVLRLDSTLSPRDEQTALARLADGQPCVAYVTPERLSDQRFRERLRAVHVALALAAGALTGALPVALQLDSIALSQTTRIALVELYHGDLYLVAVNEDRVSLLDKVTSTEVVEKVRYPRGRPTAAGS